MQSHFPGGWGMSPTSHTIDKLLILTDQSQVASALQQTESTLHDASNII